MCLQDDYAGLYHRWYISFNITMLRLISFSVDYYWAHNLEGNDSDVCPSAEMWPLNLLFQGEKELSEQQRRALSHPKLIYSFPNFVAYALYPPLYLAGPIITFNDFMWQVRPSGTLIAEPYHSSLTASISKQAAPHIHAN